MEKIYPLVYKIEIIEFDFDGGVSESYEDCGFLFAENYTDAARKLEDYYGEDILSINELYFIDEEKSILPLSKETYEAIKHEYEA